MAKYLTYIDGIRAIAVLAVVGSHYFENIFPLGYLGVDVFFVISGFVITKYLAESRFENLSNFFLTFYSKRFRRLMPALVFCVILTTFLFLFITTRPSVDVFKTGAWSIIGLSNLYLYKIAADYFSLDVTLNPFTHTWSLGVEEQFYLFYPALLLFAGLIHVSSLKAKKRIYLLFLATFGSFFAYLSTKNQNAAFYLLPYRFWELALGCLAYLYLGKIKINFKIISNFSLLIIFAIFFLHTKSVFILMAAAIFTATLLYTVKQTDASYAFLNFPLLRHIGRLSYSIYLWHWPVLVIGKYAVGDGIGAKVIFLLVTYLMSLLSYHFIETPFRDRKIVKTDKAMLISSLASAFTLFFVIGWVVPKNTKDYNNTLPDLFGVQPPAEWYQECHGENELKKHKDPFHYCLHHQRSVSKTNVVYLLGDSHAAQFYSMMEDATANTKYRLRFINSGDSKDFPYSYLDDSKPFAAKTIEYLKQNFENGDYVVIAFHSGRFNNSRDKHIPVTEVIDQNDRTHLFVENMKHLLTAVKPLGIKVILIQDTPLMSAVLTSSSCALQIQLFGKSICQVSRLQAEHTRSRQQKAFETLAAEFSNVFLWDPLSVMFKDQDQIDVIDEAGNYRMWDWNHITVYQSKKMAKEFYGFFKNTMN